MRAGLLLPALIVILARFATACEEDVFPLKDWTALIQECEDRPGELAPLEKIFAEAKGSSLLVYPTHIADDLANMKRRKELVAFLKSPRPEPLVVAALTVGSDMAVNWGMGQAEQRLQNARRDAMSAEMAEALRMVMGKRDAGLRARALAILFRFEPKESRFRMLEPLLGETDPRMIAAVIRLAPQLEIQDMRIDGLVEKQLISAVEEDVLLACCDYWWLARHPAEMPTGVQAGFWRLALHPSAQVRRKVIVAVRRSINERTSMLTAAIAMLCEDHEAAVRRDARRVLWMLNRMKTQSKSGMQ